MFKLLGGGRNGEVYNIGNPEPKISLDEGLLKMYNYYKRREVKYANKVSQSI